MPAAAEWACVPSTAHARVTPTAPTCPPRAWREVARAARAAAEVADEDEYEGLPDEFGATPLDGLASPALGQWSTERKVELALAIERAARAREGVTQVENAVYSDAEGSVALVNSRGFSSSYSATQAWAYASAFAGEGADLMTGMGVGLGRDPDALDAGGDRRRGRRARARAGGRAPAGEQALPGGARLLRSRLLPRLHRRDAVGGRSAARPLALRRAARATRWPTPPWHSPTTARTPTAPPAHPSTARDPPRGARP